MSDVPDDATPGHLDAQQPTLPGKVDGIISLDPLVLQCRSCGDTLTRTGQRSTGVFLLTCGWNFHTCEGPAGVRRCRTCLAEAKAACPNRRCK